MTDDMRPWEVAVRWRFWTRLVAPLSTPTVVCTHCECCGSHSSQGQGHFDLLTFDLDMLGTHRCVLSHTETHNATLCCRFWGFGVFSNVSNDLNGFGCIVQHSLAVFTKHEQTFRLVFLVSYDIRKRCHQVLLHQQRWVRMRLKW